MNAEITKGDFVITRIFDAPLELVIQVWTGTFEQLAEYLRKL
jgi:uncharacterized protein YndB with AHSA1/START domain